MRCEENLNLSLPPELERSYREIAAILPTFSAAGLAAVDLALADPAAGAANFERFRAQFSGFEQIMDGVSMTVRAELTGVRAKGFTSARQQEFAIRGALLAGIALLGLVTIFAMRLVQRIANDLARSREEAQRLALHDALTELPNRAFLAERLEESLGQAQRDGSMLAMLCVDLDRFKQVNDTLGHPVGDALLRAVAGRLRDCVRRSDTVARLGGDEFAVIQSPLATLEDASGLAQRIVNALSEPYTLGEHQLVIGASVGVALAPSDSVRADSLLMMADMALYRAKADGRGMSRFFEPEMDAKLQARRTLELDLRRALGMGEFELHYQPLIDVSSGAVSAVEALVRWRHPERGLVPPDEFVPLAEETGLIVPLGAWVIEQACQHAVTWPSNVRVAVNVSAAQFKGAALRETVANALAAAGLAPQRLEIEITETALLTNADTNLAILRELRAMGVRIAMDDFGTGYSSLGYLRSFPFDKIKIDRSFVRDIETSADCKAIVRAVTSLGGNLGIATTAEGVETREQLCHLQAEGCSEVQGYLFSRPVPADEVLLMIATVTRGGVWERAVSDCLAVA